MDLRNIRNTRRNTPHLRFASRKRVYGRVGRVSRGLHEPWATKPKASKCMIMSMVSQRKYPAATAKAVPALSSQPNARSADKVGESMHRIAKGITIDTWTNDTPRQFLDDARWIEISFAEGNPNKDNVFAGGADIRPLH